MLICHNTNNIQSIRTPRTNKLSWLCFSSAIFYQRIMMCHAFTITYMVSFCQERSTMKLWNKTCRLYYTMLCVYFCTWRIRSTMQGKQVDSKIEEKNVRRNVYTHTAIEWGGGTEHNNNVGKRPSAENKNATNESDRKKGKKRWKFWIQCQLVLIIYNKSSW